MFSRARMTCMTHRPGRGWLAVLTALAVALTSMAADTTFEVAAYYSPRLPATGPTVSSRLDMSVEHGCVVTASGGVQCWGTNTFGQLGDGTTTGRQTPVDVLLPGNVRAVSVAVGWDHSCALLDDGSVTCWGADFVGQLGAGAGDQRPGPVTAVMPANAKAVAITAGTFHTCAVLDTGGATCWGTQNGGAGSGGSSSEAPQIVAMPAGTTAVAISAGPTHTCAALDTGEVTCWGSNVFGQFGSGTTTSVTTTPSTPVALANGERAVGVSVGNDTTCALSDTGQVQCWGWNLYGQVGDATTTDRWSPTTVALPGSARAAAVVAGSQFACALLATGTPFCWGDNSRGQHSDGSLTDSVVAMATSHQTVCALLANGTMTCWGDNTFGQLGNDSAGGWLATPTAPRAVGSTTMITRVGVGSAHSCALNTAGHVWCWGDNAFGQLGVEVGGNSLTAGAPVVLPASGRARDIAVGYQHTCALLTEGSVSCWGQNVSGQVGGIFASHPTPSSPIALPGSGVAQAISAGGEHTCALLTDGDIACWGDNAYGQLGGGAMVGGGAPNLVVLPAGGVKALRVAAGGFHTCALLTNGVMTCWGNNIWSQLGDGTTTNRSLPVTLSPSPASLVVAVDTGWQHSCALLAGGGITCWGSNQWGQLGTAPSGAQVTITAPAGPVALPGSRKATTLTVGATHTCALLGDGTASCWGYNASGQLGDGTWNSPVNSPIAGALHATGVRIQSLSAGTFHTCAVLSDGTATCWGLNDRGQVGDGTTTNRPSPTAVTLTPPTTMTASAGDTAVHVTWSEPASPFLPQTWTIEGSTDDTTWWTATTTVVSPTGTTVSGLTNGTSYRFRAMSTTPVRTATVTLAATVSPTASASPALTPVMPPSVWPFMAPEMVEGDDPAGVATALSRRRFAAGSAPVVHVAVASRWVDAVVAGAAAVAVNGPVLLVANDAVSSSTIGEIRRLGPRQVVVVGGFDAIGPDVIAAIEAIQGVSVTRVHGPDRYSTAAAVSSGTHSPGVHTAFLVDASSSIDGIGAARFGGPLLLTDRTTLPSATAHELRRLQPSRVVVIGGTSVIADTVMDQVTSVIDVAVERWWGADRFVTAAAVANAERGAVSTAVIVQGHTLSGLAASTLLSDTNSALFLAQPGCLPQATRTALDRWRPTTVITVGARVDLTRTC